MLILAKIGPKICIKSKAHFLLVTCQSLSHFGELIQGKRWLIVTCGKGRSKITIFERHIFLMDPERIPVWVRHRNFYAMVQDWRCKADVHIEIHRYSIQQKRFAIWNIECK